MNTFHIMTASRILKWFSDNHLKESGDKCNVFLSTKQKDVVNVNSAQIKTVILKNCWESLLTIGLEEYMKTLFKVKT